MGVFQQLKVLTWKNALLKKRAIGGTICQIITPIIFSASAILLFYVFQKFSTTIDPSSFQINSFATSTPVFGNKNLKMKKKNKPFTHTSHKKSQITKQSINYSFKQPITSIEIK